MFYRFLCNLFDITIEIDGSINRLSSYTVDMEWHLHKILRNKQHLKVWKTSKNEQQRCPLCMSVR